MTHCSCRLFLNCFLCYVLCFKFRIFRGFVAIVMLSYDENKLGRLVATKDVLEIQKVEINSSINVLP